MSEFLDEPEALPIPDEMESLKAKCAKVGLTYHPSIGLDSLKAKYANFMSDSPLPEKEDGTVAEQGEMTVAAHVESTSERQQRLRREATKLIRVVVTCMNPLKKEWEGEIMSVGNNVVGTHKKFVPFNVDVGYHVPQIIYDMMKERKCQVFYEGRDNANNRVRKSKMIPEFAITVLDPLTEAELKQLAQRQAMAAGTAAA